MKRYKVEIKVKGKVVSIVHHNFPDKHKKFLKPPIATFPHHKHIVQAATRSTTQVVTFLLGERNQTGWMLFPGDYSIRKDRVEASYTCNTPEEARELALEAAEVVKVVKRKLKI